MCEFQFREGGEFRDWRIDRTYTMVIERERTLLWTLRSYNVTNFVKYE